MWDVDFASLLDKIKFISNTKESWEKGGKFDPPFLEVTKEETEYCFDIWTRDKINDLKSSCVFISKEKARELADWILKI